MTPFKVQFTFHNYNLKILRNFHAKVRYQVIKDNHLKKKASYSHNYKLLQTYAIATNEFWQSTQVEAKS